MYHPHSPQAAPLGLRVARGALGLLFGLLSLLGRRATHGRGVAAAGSARIVDSPRFPAHDFFVPGRVFPVVVRHANLTFGDDRMRDIRGATLRFGGLSDNALFDLPMNTGVTSAFWDVRSFVDFLVASARGLGALRRFSQKYPLAHLAAKEALVQGPDSYAELAYYGQLIYRFTAVDGQVGFVRYRLVPEGPIRQPTLDADPWERERDPDDARAPDYLRDELRSRLERGPVRYRFQLQHREQADGEDLHAGKAWDDEWHDVAEVTLEHALHPAQAERLRFNIAHQPASLGIHAPRSFGDYHGVAFLRAGVYPFAQWVRTRFTRAAPEWDYRLESPLPRVRRTHGLPERYSWPRFVATYTGASARLFLLYALHALLARRGWLTAAHIQRHHRENLTLRVDRREPARSRSDEWLVDRLLNGFSPLSFHQVDEQRVAIEYVWDGLQLEGPLELPNVRAVLRRDGPTLRFEEIRVQHRVDGDLRPWPRLEAPRVVRPGDGSRWELAKHLLRNCWVLDGQALGHFVCCHINGEQYAVAARRQLHHNPIRALLVPHLKEVVVINDQGDGTIFGESGVLTTNSALQGAAADGLFVTHLGGLSWSGYRPRAPVCEADRFSAIANLYWDTVCAYVGSFITRNREGIGRHWSEVFALSFDLVSHSVRYTPPPAVDGASPPSPGPVYASVHDRVRIEGETKAVHPLTTTRGDPTEEDLRALGQLCTYVIFHTTLLHTWTNDVMHDDLGELAFANGGVPAEEVRRCWELEVLPPLVPPPRQAGYQLFFANYLSGVRYGLLTRNERGDIEPGLIAAVVARRAEFEALGFDVDGIRAWINI